MSHTWTYKENAIILYITILSRDNIPTIVLAQWDVQTDYLEDEFLSSVLPVFFADEPEKATAAALADLPSLKKDVERLQRVFFIPEAVQLEEARNIVKKPRLGEADFVYKSRNLDRLFDSPLPVHRSTGLFPYSKKSF